MIISSIETRLDELELVFQAQSGGCLLPIDVLRIRELLLRHIVLEQLIVEDGCTLHLG